MNRMFIRYAELLHNMFKLMFKPFYLDDVSLLSDMSADRKYRDYVITPSAINKTSF